MPSPGEIPNRVRRAKALPKDSDVIEDGLKDGPSVARPDHRRRKAFGRGNLHPREGGTLTIQINPYCGWRRICVVYADVMHIEAISGQVAQDHGPTRARIKKTRPEATDPTNLEFPRDGEARGEAIGPFVEVEDARAGESIDGGLKEARRRGGAVRHPIVDRSPPFRVNDSLLTLVVADGDDARAVVDEDALAGCPDRAVEGDRDTRIDRELTRPGEKERHIRWDTDVTGHNLNVGDSKCLYCTTDRGHRRIERCIVLNVDGLSEAIGNPTGHRRTCREKGWIG